MLDRQWDWIHYRDLDTLTDVSSRTLLYLNQSGFLKGRKSIQWGGWTTENGWFYRTDAERFVQWWATRQPGKARPAGTFCTPKTGAPVLMSSSGVAWLICFPAWGRVLAPKAREIVTMAFSARRDAVLDYAILEDVDLTTIKLAHSDPATAALMLWARRLFENGLSKASIHPRGERDKYQQYQMPTNEHLFSYTDHKRLTTFAKQYLANPPIPQLAAAGPRWGEQPIDMRIHPRPGGKGYAVHIPGSRKQLAVPKHAGLYRPHLDLLYLDKARKLARQYWADDGMRPKD